MGFLFGVWISVGIIILILLAVSFAYIKLILHRRNIRRRYGHRAGKAPPCCIYDALPMCFRSSVNDGYLDDNLCKPCPCFMKYEPDPDEPPAAAYMANKREIEDDTSRVPDIGNQPPPSYGVASNDVTKHDGAATAMATATAPPAYDEINEKNELNDQNEEKIKERQLEV